MMAVYFNEGSAVCNCFQSTRRTLGLNFILLKETEYDVSNILLNSNIFSTTIIINTYYVEVIFVTSLRDCHFLSSSLII